MSRIDSFLLRNSGDRLRNALLGKRSIPKTHKHAHSEAQETHEMMDVMKFSVSKAKSTAALKGLQ